MKRFLSWLTLIGCYLVVCIWVSIVLSIAWNLLSLYATLSAFLKIIVTVIGGTFFLSLLFAPVFYGASFTVALSEKVRESNTGMRYIILGIIVIISCILEAFTGFMVRDVIIGLYGALVIHQGVGIRKGT